MVLTADIGNSNINFRVYEAAGASRCSFKITTDRAKSADEYMVTMDSLFRLCNFEPKELDGAIIGSVVPDLTKTVSSAITALSNVIPMVVGPGIRTSLDIKADNPSEVGADIVADAVAAIGDFPVPIIVCDLGTATTILSIDAKRRLTDAYILPGVYSSYSALIRDTAEIACVPLFTPKIFSGKSTAASVNTGIVYAAAFTIDGFIAQITKSYQSDKVSVIATGGAAKLVSPLCRNKIIVQEHLTCDGLYRIYLKNCAN